jgi:metal-dependent amidase/aminoacylase/carboxypeptidase family protein
VSLQYGSKYVLDDFNGASNSGYTDLTGVELRHDLNRRTCLCADYRSQGPYIALRVKFDQDTIKKNKNNWPFASTQ